MHRSFGTGFGAKSNKYAAAGQGEEVRQNGRMAARQPQRRSCPRPLLTTSLPILILSRWTWGGSSAGRAVRSQCTGREFDPPPLHFIKPCSIRTCCKAFAFIAVPAWCLVGFCTLLVSVSRQREGRSRRVLRSPWDASFWPWLKGPQEAYQPSPQATSQPR